MRTNMARGNGKAPPPSWQSIMADAVRGAGELCRLLGLPPETAASAEKAEADFSLLVPQPYLARIPPGEPNHPLLVQILPQVQECLPVEGFGADPVGEAAATCGDGLLRKYAGRVLMVTTGRCAIHCRFCFRRHFPYQQSAARPGDWERALEQIAQDPSLGEVILSGGDPLMVDDSRLAELAERLAAIPHVRRLRLHTRLPIVIPQRVDDHLLTWLRATRLATLMVVHVNHAAEIDAQVAEALGRLVDAGVPVLSQSVLLRGVNDDVETLAELFTRLVDLRVMPYYLHQLDPVAGAAHFLVPEARGVELIAQLKGRLPGYAVPRYVRETIGGLSKEELRGHFGF